MRNALKFVLINLALLSLRAMAQDTLSVVRRPLVVTAKVEMGSVVKGDTTMGLATDDQFLSRTGFSLMQEILVDQRLDLKIGVVVLFITRFRLPAVRLQAMVRNSPPEYPKRKPSTNWGNWIIRSPP